VRTRVAHPFADDPWGQVTEDLVDLMLEANLAPPVAERLAFELSYWAWRNPDRARDGAWDEPDAS